MTVNLSESRFSEIQSIERPGSEQAAQDFLKQYCWPQNREFCPKCRNRKIYRLADDRLRCPVCRYTFHDFSRRWINTGGLSCGQWLQLIALFQEELTANQMAPKLHLSYNTTYRALTVLRLAILSQAIDNRQYLGKDAEIDLGLSLLRLDKGEHDFATNPIPVFGILDSQGLGFIDLIPGMLGESLFHFHLNFHLRLVRLGNIIISDRYKRYDALIACGDDSLPYRLIKPKRGRTHIETVKNGFWDFAESRLKRYNGITPRRFPLYLKELEFRYNHRDEDIFPLLVGYLCSFVPESAYTQGKPL